VDLIILFRMKAFSGSDDGKNAPGYWKCLRRWSPLRVILVLAGFTIDYR
jgi:hypothetical protein